MGACGALPAFNTSRASKQGVYNDKANRASLAAAAAALASKALAPGVLEEGLAPGAIAAESAVAVVALKAGPQRDNHKRLRT